MTQEAQRPSEAAMRFAVKWHQALQLDAMGVAILAKAYDEDANTRIESGVVAELASALKVIAAGHGCPMAVATDALNKLETSK